MCKFVCLLGFAGALFRKVTRASVVICVCVYWRGTASWLGRALALRLRPALHYISNLSGLIVLLGLLLSLACRLYLRAWPARVCDMTAASVFGQVGASLLDPGSPWRILCVTGG